MDWTYKKTQYFKKTGKEAELQLISKELNIPIEKIKSALIALSPVEYFNTYDAENEYTQLDLSNNIIREDSIPYTELIELNEIIDELPDLEKKVMKLRYFEDFTQAKTGEILGISQVQVSRIERKALMLLKKEYTN
ncbi:sigma-70 family RNA polymerase sigma factor [Peptacetobacter hiranonis]|uniref:sigma-70 family RNA polymerase sigma factor n=1 Tax=Peptacetobacter hiranonis TaxID=89152 RepID=UPI001916DADE|nr:sigma-70 family RNA polymerase sigma factor [Peptacetobacter hiranonis]QQQ86336.1 sigma-70 family RNA polymerase sigma factor [Peptacetobacter hiranonis]